MLIIWASQQFGNSPPAEDAVLLEDGNPILLESGEDILLE